MMSTLSLVLYFVAICIMMGGIIYYIVFGSKGDLSPMKAVAIIAGSVLAGMFVATLAAVLQ